jgi:hypothetical protein
MEIFAAGIYVILVGLVALSLAAFTTDTDNPDKAIAKRAKSLASGQYAVGAVSIVSGCVVTALGYSRVNESNGESNFLSVLGGILWSDLMMVSLLLSLVCLFFGFNLIFRLQESLAYLAKSGYRVPAGNSRGRRNILTWGIILVVFGGLRIIMYVL